MSSFFNNLLVRHFRTPQYLIFFVSRSCWTRCDHCWYNETWKSENIDAPELDFSEIEKIVNSIKRIHFLSLTGGEAFMRDDIVALTRLFVTKTRLGRYQIPTSGFDTDGIVIKTEKILGQNPGIPFRVDVSLDGTEEVHDAIRNRTGSFRQAVETIKELNRLKKKYSFFDVGVITTISNKNQHEVAPISEMIEKIHSDGEWMVNIIRGDPREAASGVVDIEHYRLAHRLIDERIARKNYAGHGGHRLAKWLSAKNIVRRKLIRAILEGTAQGGYCSAGSLGGVIYNDGSVFPCEMTDVSFGNLRNFNYHLPLLWNSGETRLHRLRLLARRCICTQECFHSINLVVQPKYWPAIIAERIRLGVGRHR